MDEIKKNSVLIVDDDSSNIIALTHILQTDYRIHAAKNGKSAIEAAKKYLPDIILLDIIMPDLNGYEVLVVLKEFENTKNIPVIFLTGLGDKESEERGLELGAADYIYKPFKKSIIKLRIENQLRIVNQIRTIELLNSNLQNALIEVEATAHTKSIFLATMSHEIRTPMNAIVGMSELLLTEDLNPNQFGCVRDIHVSAVALLEIINDILEISKIQAGKLELVYDHYDFLLLVDNISSMVNFLIKNKDEDIVFNLLTQNDLPKCLYGDDIRLRQVLLNILGNAVKFTKKGSVQLTISTTDTSINFVIADTGMGIEEKYIPKLFDAFSQADMRRNRSQEGTGLGLSITKSLLDIMGGKISVESQYGKGTVFHITIPKVLGDEARIVQPGVDEINISAPDVKILVVDDNSINLNVACGLLKLYKINAETAISGRQAIDMIGSNHYDLIFMDHMMPEMDGIEATKIIREMGITIPIIALTANVMTSAKEEFYAIGVNDFMSKPINRSLLSQTLKTWLPPEKIIMLEEEKITANMNESPATNEFWQKIEKIKGLSLETGLDRVSGQRDIFEKSLKLTIKGIEKCDKNLSVFLASGDMRNFTIEVHSMKGTLANIGVMELAMQASALEVAGNNADMLFCNEKLQPFLDELTALKTSLINSFEEKESSLNPQEISVELTAELTTEFTTILETLKAAFDNNDFLAIDTGMANLSALKPGSALQEEIEKIKDAVLVMDYEVAVDIIQKCMEIIK
ncbi:MAG: response regulator [Treponema sp.]|nr:response regulator [Treponema sp.]